MKLDNHGSVPVLLVSYIYFLYYLTETSFSHAGGYNENLMDKIIAPFDANNDFPKMLQNFCELDIRFDTKVPMSKTDSKFSQSSFVDICSE